MPWRHNVAQKRIAKLIDEAPAIEVQKFHEDYLPQFLESRKALLAEGHQGTPPLYELPKGRAVVVDAVHVYVTLVNYDDYRMEEHRETEASHAKALKFLHLHYSACDRAMEFSPAQRVDFHGGRMHAVVVAEGENGVTEETVSNALAFVRDLRYVAEQANKELADGEFEARFRIGVDAGRCVAINNGTGHEQEPMFLGSPANHAAKLADGDEPGIYLSNRVRTAIGQTELSSSFESLLQLDEATFGRLVASRDIREGIELGFDQMPRSLDGVINEWRTAIQARSVPDPTNPNFVFHYKRPPLAEIKFEDISPSKSIRMPLASIYADLSGFTDYIDRAIALGMIADAVKALHVIREEFQNVVHDDFGGRKVRFIGDCIHALHAEGDHRETNSEETIMEAAKCAGAIRSSFDLCKSALMGVNELGLAIGVEYGQTPISKIGIQGDRSVRVASSKTTSVSEAMQKSCDHNETRFGPEVLKLAPVALNDLISSDGMAGDLQFDDVSTAVSAPAVAEVAAPYARAHAPSVVTDTRAHFEKK